MFHANALKFLHLQNVFWHGLWSPVHPTDVQWDSGQVRRSGVHVSNIPISLLEVALHQDRCLHVCTFWIVVVLKDKSGQDLLPTAWAFLPQSQILSTSMSFPIPETQKHPPSIIFPPLSFTVGCTRLHLFSKYRQRLYGQRAHFQYAYSFSRLPLLQLEVVSST